MVNDREFAIRYLKAVEKKNQGYFIANRLSILDCVEIDGLNKVTVRVIENTLPFEISDEIESMFWR